MIEPSLFSKQSYFVTICNLLKASLGFKTKFHFFNIHIQFFSSRGVQGFRDAWYVQVCLETSPDAWRMPDISRQEKPDIARHAWRVPGMLSWAVQACLACLKCLPELLRHALNVYVSCQSIPEMPSWAVKACLKCRVGLLRHAWNMTSWLHTVEAHRGNSSNNLGTL